MSGYRRDLAHDGVMIDGVSGPFPQKKTTVFENVAQKLALFHVLDSDTNSNQFALGFGGSFARA